MSAQSFAKHVGFMLFLTVAAAACAGSTTPIEAPEVPQTPAPPLPVHVTPEPAPTQAGSGTVPTIPQATQAAPAPTASPQPTAFQPQVVLSGQFEDAGPGHTGSGTATFVSMADGSHLLSFREFTVCCGPELYVYFSSNPNPTSKADLGTTVNLSPLLATEGDQDYVVPASVDLGQVNSLVIWCRPFEVIISSASLE